MFLAVSRRARNWLLVGAVALTYFLGAKFAFSFVHTGFHAEASVFYPPAGIALAAALIFGRKTALGVALGALAFARSLDSISWLTAIGFSVGSLVEVLLAATLLKKLEFNPALSRVRDVVAFMGAVYVASAAGATISVTNEMLAELVPVSQRIGHWFITWLGDAVAMIILTPAFLVWATSPPFSRWRTLWQQKPQVRRRIIEVLLWLVLLLTCSAIVVTNSTSGLPLELREIARSLLNYLPFLFVVWAALQLGQRGTVLSLLIVFWVAIWGMAQIASTIASPADRQYAVFQFQTFISTMIAISLVLAAAIAEQKETQETLKRRIDRDRLLAESTLRIRQSLDLNHILDTTVAEVRHFLNADRAFISVFNEAGYTNVVAEAVAPGWRSLLNIPSPRPVLKDLEAIFADHPIRVNHNSETAPKNNEFLKIYYELYQIKASIGVALHQDGKLFGILNVNQCGAPRYWKAFEIELLEQLATQVELSIRQGRLYQQVQTFANDLEQQVQERTLQLSQSLEELKELNALKDTFIHAVSHDFRTPTMGALMVLKRLQKGDAETISLPRSTLDRMVDSTERQLSLIHSLLDDTSGESRPITLKNQRIDFRELINTTLADLNALLSQIRIQNLVSVDLPEIVADRLQLQRVLDYVLRNAVEHNPPGITVTFQATVKDEELRCAIADDGVGMTQEQCDQLFTKPFLRTTHNRHRTGFGLGLLLCSQIITAHHGHIGIDSQPDQGTEIWFTLPLAPTP